MTQTISAPQHGVVSKSGLLNHWLGHRGLTRRVMAAFPEKEFFNFSIGGMRTFADISMELLGIGAPGIREIATGEPSSLKEEFQHGNRQEAFLQKWDEDTATIARLWEQIPEEKFQETIKAFGQYEGTVLSTIQYYVDNEIHHRGQGYIYLRALGIEPPAFWDR